MKAKFLIPIIILILVIAIVYFVRTVPLTAKQQFEHAERKEAELLEDLTVLEIQDPQEYEKVADEYHQEIIREYEKVIEKYGDSEFADDAMLAIGDFEEVILENFEKAIATYDSLRKAYPDSGLADDALFRIGKIKGFKLSDSDKLKGIEDLESLLREYPKSDLRDDATYEIAEIYKSIKELDKALEWYEKLVKDYPESDLVDDARMKIAEIYEAKEEYKKAAEEYEKVEKEGESDLAEEAKKKKEKIGEKKLEEDVDRVEKGYYGGGSPYDYTKHLEREEILLNERISAQNLDVLHYDIQMEVDPESKELSVQCKLRLKNEGDAKEELKLKLNGSMLIESAMVNGNAVSQRLSDKLLTLPLPEKVEKGEEVALELSYKGIENDSPDWGGDQIDPKGSYLRFESTWYPQCSWGDLYTSNIEITVPKDLQAVATGILKDEKKEGDKKIFRWEMNKPVFVLCAAVADYKVKKIKYKNVELSSYLFPEDASKSSYYLTLTKDILDFYSDRFCDYPFESFSIAEIPFFPGGYGSPTLVLLADFSVREGDEAIPLLAHEMAHQWWGNLVSITMTGSSMQWLNEGFATYSDALYTEHRKGREKAVEHLEEITDIYRESIQYAPDEAIAACTWSSPLYQPIVYYKGAKVLDMLRFVVGDGAFFEILREYAEKHSFQNVKLEDFIQTCNENSPEKLDWFFDQWLYDKGAMNAEIDSVEIVQRGNFYSIKAMINQENSVFRMPMEIAAKSEQSTEKRVLIDKENFIWETNLPTMPSEIILDPDNWILWEDKVGNVKNLENK